jgi:secreted trypsin-like serine protease
MLRIRRVTLLVVALLALPCAQAHAIVGGKDAPQGTYDAVAQVTIGGSASCGGTLIAPTWVLSAGHCGSITGGILGTPIGWPPGVVVATLGTTRRDGVGGQRIGVDRIVLSPAYLATSGNDVSLLHLEAPARPASVQVVGTNGADLWKTGTVATIAGFGVTSDGGQMPATMKIADVPIVADATCDAAYPDSFESRTQMCAGYPQGGVDTCQGDSGGPLFVRDGAGALKVAGVTSYGDGCAKPGKYGIYARVAGAALRDWVRATVPSAIDDAAGPATGTPPATPPPPPPPARTGALKLERLVAVRGGARLTLVVPAKGRLALRWSAGGKHGTRNLTLRAGRRSLLLHIPRRLRRVKVAATLSPTAGGALASATSTLRVR